MPPTNIYSYIPHHDVYGDIDFYADEYIATFSDPETSTDFIEFFRGEEKYSWEDETGINICLDFHGEYPYMDTFINARYTE